MLNHTYSILLCFIVITFKMENITAETVSGPVLLVTFIPDSNSLQIQNYSYCRYQITEGGIPMTKFSSLFFNKKVVRYHSVVADYQSDVLFIYDYITNTIYREPNYSQEAISKRISIHSGVAGFYTKMAFDWLSNNLYWTDIMYEWIGVISLRTGDQGMYRILLYENIQRPHGITLDPLQGFLLWTDIGRTIKIERSSLSGDDRKVLISSGLITPYSIVADVRTQKIFWIDDGRDTTESAQYDGRGRKLIKRFSHAALFHIEVFKELVYVSDRSNKQVHVMDKNTGKTEIIVTVPDHIPYGITMYHPDVRPPNITGYCGEHQCSHICVSKKDGPTCMCKEGFILNGKNCSEDSGPFHRGLIVSNSTSLCIADIHAISASGYNLTCHLLTAGITYFELDTVRREVVLANNSGLYFTSVDQFTVHRLFAVSGNVSGLAFDWKDRSIYWTEVDTGKIFVVTSDRSISLTILSALESPRNLLVLPLERLMLWVSGSNLYKIESSKLDGTDRRVVVHFSAISNPASISFDPSSQRLYFVDDIYIKTCNLNGSDVQKLAEAPSNTESVYVYKRYLLLHYRPSSYLPSSIKSFAIEGLSLRATSPSQFIAIGRITDMKVFDERIQPTSKGPCDELNGGCEQICIAIGRVSRMCRCQLGFQADPTNENACSSSPVYNNFLLVSDWTHAMIYQLSLDTNDIHALDIKKITEPSGVAYDYIRKTVIWGSTSEQQILSVNINGSAEMPLFPTGDRYNTFPDRFAIDFSTGNIYYTAIRVNEAANPRGGYVAVLSFRRLHKKLITGLRKPRAIVLYPSKGLMFWTDFGSDPHIGRSAMDGQNSSKLITNGVTWPNGLALDYKTDRLYWSDGRTDRVESCGLDGTNRKLVFVDSGAHLMDITFDKAGNLYYTAWNRPYITKLVMSQSIQAEHLFENTELGRLDDLDIYTVDIQPPPNVHCLYNNGNCSTFCLPTMYGRSCSCEDGDSIREDGKTCLSEPSTSNTTAETTTSRAIVSSTSNQTKTATVLPTTENITFSTPTTSSQPQAPTRDNNQTLISETTSTRTTSSRSQAPTRDNNHTLIFIAAGGSAGFVVLIVAIVLIIRCIRRRKMSKQGVSERTISSDNNETELPPRRIEPSDFVDRPVSSAADIYDTIEDDRSSSDPEYMTPLSKDREMITYI